MKKITTTTILTLMLSISAFAQESFESLWRQVDQLDQKKLPKSALKFVDTIYVKATKEKNAPQIIKSLLYKSKFSMILEEEAQLKIINDFKLHISKSASPTKNILQNLLANMYWHYFIENRYQFYNRTQTANKVNESDFRTWDLTTIFKEIHHNFSASLLNTKELQNTDITKFKEILVINNQERKESSQNLQTYFV